MLSREFFFSLVAGTSFLIYLFGPVSVPLLFDLKYEKLSDVNIKKNFSDEGATSGTFYRYSADSIDFKPGTERLGISYYFKYDMNLIYKIKYVHQKKCVDDSPKEYTFGMNIKQGNDVHHVDIVAGIIQLVAIHPKKGDVLTMWGDKSLTKRCATKGHVFIFKRRSIYTSLGQIWLGLLVVSIISIVLTKIGFLRPINFKY